MGRRSRGASSAARPDGDVSYTLLGQRVKTLRRAMHLTQSQLADRVGCARPTIGLFESGKTNPTLEFLLALAAALGMDSFAIGWAIRPDELRRDGSQPRGDGGDLDRHTGEELT